VRELYIIL